MGGVRSSRIPEVQLSFYEKQVCINLLRLHITNEVNKRTFLGGLYFAKVPSMSGQIKAWSSINFHYCSQRNVRFFLCLGCKKKVILNKYIGGSFITPEDKHAPIIIANFCDIVCLKRWMDEQLEVNDLPSKPE